MIGRRIKSYTGRTGWYVVQHLLTIATLVFAALGSWFSYQSLRYQQQATAEADFDIELENTVENLARFERVDEHTLVVFAPFGERHSLYLKITNLGEMAARKATIVFEGTEAFEMLSRPYRTVGVGSPLMEELGEHRFQYQMDWFHPKQIEWFQFGFSIRKETQDGLAQIRVTVGAENTSKRSVRRFEFKRKAAD